MFIHYGAAHIDTFKNRVSFLYDLTDRAGGAYFSAFHTQDAGFLTGNDVRRINGCRSIFQTEKFYTTIGADFATLTAMNTATGKFSFCQCPRWSNIAQR